MKIKQTDMFVVVTENICSQSAYLKKPLWVSDPCHISRSAPNKFMMAMKKQGGIGNTINGR